MLQTDKHELSRQQIVIERLQADLALLRRQVGGAGFPGRASSSGQGYRDCEPNIGLVSITSADGNNPSGGKSLVHTVYLMWGETLLLQICLVLFSHRHWEEPQQVELHSLSPRHQLGDLPHCSPNDHLQLVSTQPHRLLEDYRCRQLFCCHSLLVHHPTNHLYLPYHHLSWED